MTASATASLRTLEGLAGTLAVPEGLGPEERNRLYRTLELAMHLDADGGPTVGGIPGEVSSGGDE